MKTFLLLIIFLVLLGVIYTRSEGFKGGGGHGGGGHGGGISRDYWGGGSGGGWGGWWGWPYATEVLVIQDYGTDCYEDSDCTSGQCVDGYCA